MFRNFTVLIGSKDNAVPGEAQWHLTRHLLTIREEAASSQRPDVSPKTWSFCASELTHVERSLFSPTLHLGIQRTNCGSPSEIPLHFLSNVDRDVFYQLASALRIGDPLHNITQAIENNTPPCNLVLWCGTCTVPTEIVPSSEYNSCLHKWCPPDQHDMYIFGLHGSKSRWFPKVLCDHLGTEKYSVLTYVTNRDTCLLAFIRTDKRGHVNNIRVNRHPVEIVGREGLNGNGQLEEDREVRAPIGLIIDYLQTSFCFVVSGSRHCHNNGYGNNGTGGTVNPLVFPGIPRNANLSHYFHHIFWLFEVQTTLNQLESGPESEIEQLVKYFGYQEANISIEPCKVTNNSPSTAHHSYEENTKGGTEDIQALSSLVSKRQNSNTSSATTSSVQTTSHCKVLWKSNSQKGLQCSKYSGCYPCAWSTYSTTNAYKQSLYDSGSPIFGEQEESCYQHLPISAEFVAHIGLPCLFNPQHLVANSVRNTSEQLVVNVPPSVQLVVSDVVLKHISLLTDEEVDDINNNSFTSVAIDLHPSFELYDSTDVMPLQRSKSAEACKTNMSGDSWIVTDFWELKDPNHLLMYPNVYTMRCLDRDFVTFTVVATTADPNCCQYYSGSLSLYNIIHTPEDNNHNFCINMFSNSAPTLNDFIQLSVAVQGCDIPLPPLPTTASGVTDIRETNAASLATPLTEDQQGELSPGFDRSSCGSYDTKMELPQQHCTQVATVNNCNLLKAVLRTYRETMLQYTSAPDDCNGYKCGAEATPPQLCTDCRSSTSHCSTSCSSKGSVAVSTATCSSTGCQQMGNLDDPIEEHVALNREDAPFEREPVARLFPTELDGVAGDMCSDGLPPGYEDTCASPVPNLPNLNPWGPHTPKMVPRHMRPGLSHPMPPPPPIYPSLSGNIPDYSPNGTYIPYLHSPLSVGYNNDSIYSKYLGNREGLTNSAMSGNGGGMRTPVDQVLGSPSMSSCGTIQFSPSDHFFRDREESMDGTIVPLTCLTTPLPPSPLSQQDIPNIFLNFPSVNNGNRPLIATMLSNTPNDTQTTAALDSSNNTTATTINNVLQWVGATRGRHEIGSNEELLLTKSSIEEYHSYIARRLEEETIICKPPHDDVRTKPSRVEDSRSSKSSRSSSFPNNSVRRKLAPNLPTRLYNNNNKRFNKPVHSGTKTAPSSRTTTPSRSRSNSTSILPTKSSTARSNSLKIAATGGLQTTFRVNKDSTRGRSKSNSCTSSSTDTHHRQARSAPSSRSNSLTKKRGGNEKKTTKNPLNSEFFPTRPRSSSISHTPKHTPNAGHCDDLHIKHEADTATHPNEVNDWIQGEFQNGRFITRYIKTPDTFEYIAGGNIDNVCMCCNNSTDDCTCGHSHSKNETAEISIISNSGIHDDLHETADDQSATAQPEKLETAGSVSCGASTTSRRSSGQGGQEEGVANVRDCSLSDVSSNCTVIRHHMSIHTTNRKQSSGNVSLVNSDNGSVRTSGSCDGGTTHSVNQQTRHSPNEVDEHNRDDRRHSQPQDIQVCSEEERDASDTAEKDEYQPEEEINTEDHPDPFVAADSTNNIDTNVEENEQPLCNDECDLDATVECDNVDTSVSTLMEEELQGHQQYQDVIANCEIEKAIGAMACTFSSITLDTENDKNLDLKGDLHENCSSSQGMPHSPSPNLMSHDVRHIPTAIDMEDELMHTHQHPELDVVPHLLDAHSPDDEAAAIYPEQDEDNPNNDDSQNEPISLEEMEKQEYEAMQRQQQQTSAFTEMTVTSTSPLTTGPENDLSGTAEHDNTLDYDQYGRMSQEFVADATLRVCTEEEANSDQYEQQNDGTVQDEQVATVELQPTCQRVDTPASTTTSTQNCSPVRFDNKENVASTTSRHEPPPRSRRGSLNTNPTKKKAFTSHPNAVAGSSKRKSTTAATTTKKGAPKRKPGCKQVPQQQQHTTQAVVETTSASTSPMLPHFGLNPQALVGNLININKSLSSIYCCTDEIENQVEDEGDLDSTVTPTTSTMEDATISSGVHSSHPESIEFATLQSLLTGENNGSDQDQEPAAEEMVDTNMQSFLALCHAKVLQDLLSDINKTVKKQISSAFIKGYVQGKNSIISQCNNTCNNTLNNLYRSHVTTPHILSMKPTHTSTPNSLEEGIENTSPDTVITTLNTNDYEAPSDTDGAYCPTSTLLHPYGSNITPEYMTAGSPELDSQQSQQDTNVQSVPDSSVLIEEEDETQEDEVYMYSKDHVTELAQNTVTKQQGSADVLDSSAPKSTSCSPCDSHTVGTSHHSFTPPASINKLTPNQDNMSCVPTTFTTTSGEATSPSNVSTGSHHSHHSAHSQSSARGGATPVSSVCSNSFISPPKKSPSAAPSPNPTLPSLTPSFSLPNRSMCSTVTMAPAVALPPPNPSPPPRYERVCTPEPFIPITPSMMSGPFQPPPPMVIPHYSLYYVPPEPAEIPDVDQFIPHQLHESQQSTRDSSPVGRETPIHYQQKRSQGVTKDAYKTNLPALNASLDDTFNFGPGQTRSQRSATPQLRLTSETSEDEDFEEDDDDDDHRHHHHVHCDLSEKDDEQSKPLTVQLQLNNDTIMSNYSNLHFVEYGYHTNPTVFQHQNPSIERQTATTTNYSNNTSDSGLLLAGISAINGSSQNESTINTTLLGVSNYNTGQQQTASPPPVNLRTLLCDEYRPNTISPLKPVNTMCSPPRAALYNSMPVSPKLHYTQSPPPGRPTTTIISTEPTQYKTNINDIDESDEENRHSQTPPLPQPQLGPPSSLTVPTIQCQILHAERHQSTKSLSSSSTYSTLTPSTSTSTASILSSSSSTGTNNCKFNRQTTCLSPFGRRKSALSRTQPRSPLGTTMSSTQLSFLCQTTTTPTPPKSKLLTRNGNSGDGSGAKKSSRSYSHNAVPYERRKKSSSAYSAIPKRGNRERESLPPHYGRARSNTRTSTTSFTFC